MPKVLIGKSETGTFKGFWAEFNGEKVGEYELDEGKLTYTLFKVPWGSRQDEPGYRVYKADERGIDHPTYELLPTGDDHTALTVKKSIMSREKRPT